MYDNPIVGKTGEQRFLERIMGRQKLKKSYQYEVKWRGLPHKMNVWIPRETLLDHGFSKLVQQFDDFEASREGAGQRENKAEYKIIVERTQLFSNRGKLMIYLIKYKLNKN